MVGRICGGFKPVANVSTHRSSVWLSSSHCGTGDQVCYLLLTTDARDEPWKSQRVHWTVSRSQQSLPAHQVLSSRWLTGVWHALSLFVDCLLYYCNVVAFSKSIVDGRLSPQCHIVMNSWTLPNTVVVWHCTWYWRLQQSWTCKSALQPYLV